MFNKIKNIVNKVSFSAKLNLSGLTNVVIENVILDSIKLDYVLVNSYGVFIFKYINNTGVISGNERNKKWKIKDKNKIIEIPNITKQLILIKPFILKTVNKPFVHIQYCIIYTNADVSKVKSSIPLIKDNSIQEYLKKFIKDEDALSINEIDDIVNKIKMLNEEKTISFEEVDDTLVTEVKKDKKSNPPLDEDDYDFNSDAFN